MEGEKEGRAPGSHPGRKQNRSEDAGWKDPVFEGDPAPDFAETFLVLMPIDPYSLHVYWGVVPEDLKGAGIAPGRPEASVVLKFYSQRTQEQEPWRDLHEHETASSGNYTLHAVEPGKRYVAELGLKTKEGDFFPLIRSRAVEPPRSEPIGGERRGKAPPKAEADPAVSKEEAEKKEAETDLTSLSEQAFESGISSKN